MRPWRGVSLPGRGLGFCVMAFELTGQVEKHLVNDHIVYDSYNTAIRVTPDCAWSIPE